mmetsp:Transcript_31735/g.81289  ORF Transcript_31735/g.81289 Transcript_31735/m.81289 type:complete len:255 (+) Transcript_31735:250-1014(+)|eukprot:jgi/Tetstr1/429634/TSEL_019532.t1
MATLPEGSTAWSDAAQKLFRSFNEPQRKLIVQLSQCPEQLGIALVAKAKSVDDPAASLGGSKAVLEALQAGTATGPAFAAFGERAVKLQYITQEQLDTVAVRLAGIEDPAEREEETVKAMRRFLCTCQPLGDNIRVQPNCKVFTRGTKSGQRKQVFDLNGMELSIEGTSPPGGEPERYNVLLEEDEDGSQAVLQIEPKYLRPCPMSECYGRDCNAAKIPEDHEADEWWEGILAHHRKCQMLGLMGPARPSGLSN